MEVLPATRQSKPPLRRFYAVTVVKCQDNRAPEAFMVGWYYVSIFFYVVPLTLSAIKSVCCVIKKYDAIIRNACLFGRNLSHGCCYRLALAQEANDKMDASTLLF